MAADSTSLIVGSGSIARRHLANLRQLRPDGRIVVLRRAQSQSGALPEADRVVNTIEEALGERPGIAIVANPAPFHVPVAQALAEAGCHLLVEKPLSDRLDGVDRLIETCDASGLTLMIGYCLRFFPSLRTMADMVQSGAVGRVLHVSTDVGQYLPDWRKTDYRQGVTAQARLGGGALFELSHEIDTALWMGGALAGVSASLGRVSDLEIDTEDCADLLLTFESGARGSVHMDLFQRAPVRRCRVVGSTATLEWDGIADTLRLGRPSESWAEVSTSPMPDRNKMYLDELEHFFACVRDGSRPIADGATGKAVLQAILAAKESAASGARCAT